VFYFAIICLAVHFFRECSDKLAWFKERKVIFAVSGAFALFAVASLVWCEDFSNCLRPTVKLAAYVIVVAAFIKWLTFFGTRNEYGDSLRRDTTIFICLFAVVLAFIAMDAMLKFRIIKSIYQFDVLKTLGINVALYRTYYRWSFAAAVLTCPIAVICCIRRKFIIAGIICLISFWSLSHVENDSGVLGLIASMFIFAMSYLRFSFTSKLFKTGLLVLSILPIFYNSVVDPRKLYESFPLLRSSTSWFHRIIILGSHAEMISRHPFLGTGIGSARQSRLHPAEKYSKDWLRLARGKVSLYEYSNMQFVKAILSSAVPNPRGQRACFISPLTGQLVFQHHLTRVTGMRCSQLWSTLDDEEIANFFRIPVQPHNIIFDIWASLGIIGVMFYLIVNFWIIDRIGKIKHRAFRAGCLGSLSAATAVSLVNYSFVNSWWMYSFPVLGGIIYLMSREADAQVAKENL
jgi:O-antigen ligase